MKKIFILILITLFSCDFVTAQTNIANPFTNSKLTAVPANPENWYMEFVDWNNTASPMISVVSFEQLMNLLSISGNQTIEDTWRFTKDLKLPPQAPSVANEAGFIYQDGLNVYFIQRVWNGAGYDYAAQRLITKSEADSLYALSEAGLDAGYINTSTNQSAIAGNKRTIGIWQFDKIRILGGSTSLPSASEKNQLGIIESGVNAGLYRSDASLAWIKISGDGTGGLPSTGIFSGATSSISWAGGYLDLSSADYLWIPVYSGTVVDGTGRLFYSDEYIYYQDGSDVSQKVATESLAQSIAEENLSYNAPTISSENEITIPMTNNNTISYELTQGSDAKTITISNYADGRLLSFRLKDLDTQCTISISGVTLDWGERGYTDFADGAWYLVQLIPMGETSDGTDICLVSYERVNR